MAAKPPGRVSREREGTDELTTQHERERGNPGALTQTLRDAFDGGLLLPGDDRYDIERMPWNRRIEPRPAIIAEARTPEDVRAAVRGAREHELPLAVQATGHGTQMPANGGLLLKTSRMTDVVVDPDRRTATAAAGALWSDVIEAAASHGLAPLSGTPAVGVAGYTLGGGIGWLSRKHGLAADSLLRAEVVSADGELVTAGADEHPDLFWALRGGGGNFGVVTSLEFRLYPVAEVYAGMSLYSIERARETLVRYREWAAEEPDELNTAVLLMRMPAAPPVPEPMRGKRVLGIRAFSLGTAEEGRRRLAPLLDAAGPPLMDAFGPMTFAQAGPAIAPAMPAVTARQHFDLFRELSDAALDILLDAAGPGADSPMDAIELRHWGGAISRPLPDAGPAGHRDVPFSILTMASFNDAQPRPAVEAYVDGLIDRLRPYTTGGSFLNFLVDPAGAESAFTAENYSRLVATKRTWDPSNLFRMNHNIPPG